MEGGRKACGMCYFTVEWTPSESGGLPFLGWSPARDSFAVIAQVVGLDDAQVPNSTILLFYEGPCKTWKLLVFLFVLFLVQTLKMTVSVTSLHMCSHRDTHRKHMDEELKYELLVERMQAVLKPGYTVSAWSGLRETMEVKDWVVVEATLSIDLLRDLS